MTWSYADWNSQATDSARLSRLRLHIDEVSAQMGPDVGAGGKYRATSSLQQYLSTLFSERDKLELKLGETDNESAHVLEADFRPRGRE